MFCPVCGAPNDEESVFCGNCGAVLDAEAASEIEAQGGPAEDTAGSPGTEGAGEEMPEEQAVASPPSPPPPPRPPARHYAPAAAGAGVPTSGLAIASLVLGIGGVTILPLLGSIVAIVLGYMARNDIRRRPGEVTGEGLALAGIVLGWISVGLAVLGLILFGGFTVCGICGAFGSGGFQ
jgi:hypothetical protein